LIAGAFIAPELPASLEPVEMDVFRLPRPLPTMTGEQGWAVMHAAARHLGVIATGEVLSPNEVSAFSFHLEGLLKERFWRSQSLLAIELAGRMGPQFRTHFVVPRFHSHAFALVWPPLGEPKVPYTLQTPDDVAVAMNAGEGNGYQLNLGDTILVRRSQRP